MMYKLLSDSICQKLLQFVLCIFPLVWLALWLPLIKSSQEIWWRVVAPVLVLFIMSFFVVWDIIRSKIVNLDNDLLHISGFLRKITVPLNEIERVSKSLLPGRLWLHFRNPTKFGSKIIFHTKMERKWGFVLFHPVHPDVTEFVMRVKQASPSNDAL